MSLNLDTPSPQSSPLRGEEGEGGSSPQGGEDEWGIISFFLQLLFLKS